MLKYLISVALILLPALAFGQGDNETPGLAIGEKAPAFELQDQNGKSHKLSNLTEGGLVAIVFYRSADW